MPPPPSPTASTAATELRLLGPPALRAASGDTLFPPRRPYQLLAYLACRRTWVARAELAELFWPDRPEGVARANLRVLLQRAQRAFPGLELQAERVRCVVDTDLQRLEAAAGAGRHAEVMALARAPLLEGLEAELPEPMLEWLALERQRLDELRQAAAASRLEASAAAPAAAGAAPARPADAFVGRRAELAELQAMLARGHRLVQVTGPGGIGKTALLRAALPLLAAQRPEGGRLVPLADLTQPAMVPARAAQALGLELGHGGDAWEQLAQFIGPRDLLLALDNAEHLQALAPAFEQLLERCPALRLLVATRQRLAIAATDAAVLVLQGLPLPDDDETDADLLRRFDAVRLFEARARDAGASAWLPRDRAALLRVLRATEGLPLALELAAAATRLLPLPELADELARSLDVLDAGVGARGLRASFDRSWALLEAPRRDTLARLAWLPAAFDRGLARQVAGATLDDLAVLVDRSWLRADGQGRFSLHPLLRQFVAERSAPDARQLAARHAAHMGHRLEALDGDAGVAALRQLDDDLPHLLAAWAWALDAGPASLLVRLARVMGRYHAVRGRAQEILPFLQHAVARIALPGRSGLAARAATLRTQAMLEFHRGLLADAQAHARLALRWAGRAGDTTTALGCLTVLGNALLFAGQAAQARAPFEQARRRALARGDLAIAAAATNGLGLVERTAGQLELALAHFHASLELEGRCGNGAAQASVLLNIGNVEMMCQRWPQARQATQQALALAQASGAQSRLAVLHTALCEIALELGELAPARLHADAAAASAAHGGDLVVATQLPLMRMRIALAEGDANGAAAALAQAVGAARDSGSSTQQLSAVIGAGRWLAAQGAAAEAARLWAGVQAHPEATPSLRAAAAQGLQAAGAAAATPLPPARLPELLDALLARLPAPPARC